MDYNFKHYLVFSFGKVEVFEPIGFDASDFVIEQDKDKWGRDTYYGSENKSLYFGNEYSEPLEVERVLDNGMILRHKTSGLDLLLNENKVFGAESIVGYELEQNGTIINIGEFDFGETFKTDGFTYAECKIIQNLEQAKIKRREDVKVDLFATEDLDENFITPIQTQRMLLKAKPVVRKSKWINSTPLLISQGGTFEPAFFNPIRNLTEYGIDDTYTWVDEYLEGDDTNPAIRDIGKSIFNSSGFATGVKVNIKLNLTTTYRTNTSNVPIQIIGKCFVSNNTPSEWLTNVNDISSDFFKEIIDVDGSFSIDQTFEILFPSIPVGAYLYVFFYSGSGGNAFLFNEFKDSFVNIELVSTGINSVIETVRYIDLIKQTYKGINGGSVVAPKFDVNGQFYNQFCFNGKLIRQIITEPFYNDLKDTIKSLDEVCADSQINKDNNYIGQYTDYYSNNDLGGFLIAPDSEFDITKNKRYLINKFNYGYEKFEKDRDEDNTLDAIHTESEWYVPNNKSENEKKVKNNFVRDPFKTESVRRRATERDNTASESDDDVFISDVVTLAPNSRGEFTAVLKYQRSDANNTFVILANKNFSWDLLGFSVGDIIILNGNNHRALIIDSRTLTLEGAGGTDSGEQTFTINYPLTNVGYVNRTNQELIFSSDLQNSDNFSNLRYSIKRNAKHWFPYLATAGKFIPNKSVKNTYFKANGECTTQFVGEPLPIKENETVLITDISNEKILSQNIIKTTVTVSFDKIKKLLDDMQVVNLDNTIGGFIRIQDNSGRVLKGYIQKATYLWKYEELSLELEERNESDFLTITYIGGVLTINEVGYDIKTSIEKRFNIFNDTIQFFDENNLYLCNRTNFSLVSFNGIVYNSADELAIAIQSV
jgi:hypothetical protein